MRYRRPYLTITILNKLVNREAMYVIGFFNGLRYVVRERNARVT